MTTHKTTSKDGIGIDRFGIGRFGMGRFGMGCLAMGLVLSTLTPSAQAGTRTTDEVKITDSQRRAEGSMGSARASTDGSQYIACTVYSTSGSNTASTNTSGTNTSGTNTSGTNTMACAARDSAGLFRSCTSTSPNLVMAARALRSHDSSSQVVFTWDASYACQTLEVANGSLYRPVYDVPSCASWTDVNINQCDSFSTFSEGAPECVTVSSQVSLSIQGTFAPTHMSIYNVPSYETYCNSLTGMEPGWSAAEPYAPEKLWTLSAGAGDKKVCVRLMNGAGWGKACGGGIHYKP